MKQRIVGVIEAIESCRPGAQELIVCPDSSPPATPYGSDDNNGGDITAGRRRALNLISLNGTACIGDRVLLNTTAVEMGLGTGGLDMVIALLGQEELETTPPGHILKLRYTPLQTPFLLVESPESPHHAAIREFETLNDTPVVCMSLHSQLPAICAGAQWAWDTIKQDRPLRLAYIMTDSAALPLALSRLIPALKENGYISSTITCGQAFGGDYEAVNLFSALACAHAVVKADIIIVGQGPGSVGTATEIGFSGIDQGIALNAAASLGGIPIAAARISFSDNRKRHQGISHHTLTVLKKITNVRVWLPIPRLDLTHNRELNIILHHAKLYEKHDITTINSEKAFRWLEESNPDVTTMGRSLQEDRAFFLAATAAGILAAQHCEGSCVVDKTSSYDTESD